MKKQLVLTCIALLTIASVSDANSIIKSVNPVSSSQPASIELMTEGVNIYKDREPGHRLVNIPASLFSEQIPQVIQNSNSDKERADYQIDVTTQELGIIYVGLDARHRENQPLAWMQDTSKTGLPTVFFDTGRTVDIDEGSTAENAGEDIDGAFNIWATIAPPGTYSFFEQTYGGGSNNYFIAADDHLLNVPIPEPTSMTLVGLGLLGLAGLRRRR